MNLDKDWEWKHTKLPCKVRNESGNPSVDELKDLLGTLLSNVEQPIDDKDQKTKEPQKGITSSVMDQLLKIQSTLGLKELSERHNNLPFNTAIDYLQEESTTKNEMHKRNIHKKFVTVPHSPPGKIMMDLHMDRLLVRQDHNALSNAQDPEELDSARGGSLPDEKKVETRGSKRSKKSKKEKGQKGEKKRSGRKRDKVAKRKSTRIPETVSKKLENKTVEAEKKTDEPLIGGVLSKKALSVFKKKYQGDLFSTGSNNMSGSVYMSRLADRQHLFGPGDSKIQESIEEVEETNDEDHGEDYSLNDTFGSTDEWTRRDLEAKLHLANTLLKWSRHASNAKRLKEEGAVQAIVRLTSYKDARVRMLCVAALRHMAAIPELRPQLLGSGISPGSSVVKIVSDLMQSNSRNKGIIKDCVVTLVHLTCMASDGGGPDEEKSVEARMVEEGVVAALKATAENHQEDLSELCMIGLYNLTCVNRGYQYIDRVIKAFTQLASPNHLNNQVNRICASAFCNLCDLPECHSRLIEEGVVQSVTTLVNRSNSDLQTYRICAIVVHLLAQTPSVCSDLVSKNVLVVLNTLSQQSDHPTLHYCSMAFLRLSKDKASQFKVANDGVTPLCNIAMKMPDKPLSSRPCATALKNLSSKPDILAELTDNKTKDDVVASLVMLLHRSPDEVTILHALQTLCNLLGSENPPTAEVLDRGALVSVMKISRKDFEEDGIHRAACLMLFNLSCIEMGKAPIVEGGAVPAIIHLSKKPEMQLKQWCSMTLCNLASVPSSVSRMVKEGALPAFIDLLQTKDTATVKYCCAALCLVAQNFHDCLRIMEEGAVPCMIEGAEDGDDTTKQSSCAVLSALSAQEECRSQLVGSGALPALMSLSKLDDPTTRERCVIALANLSCEAAVQGLMVDAGVVPVLAELSFTHSEESQLYCAKALCNLTCHHGSEQKIIEQDGIASLMMICMVRSVNVETKRICTKALLNLINENTIQRLVDEGIITACTAMSKLREDPDTQLACSNIYAVLSASIAARRVLLERKGALHALFSLLEASKDHTTQVNCGKAICNLLSFKDSQVATVRKGAVPQLNRLAKLGDAETEVRCADTFFLLTDNLECRAQMRGKTGDKDDDESSLADTVSTNPLTLTEGGVASGSQDVPPKYEAPSFAVMIFLARSPNAQAKWSTARSLVILSWHHDSRNDLVSVNVVPALVALVEDAASASLASDRAGPEVAELCCRSLCYLAFEPAHRPRMAKDQVVQALSRALETLPGNQTMIDVVLVTLRSLSEAEDAVRCALVDQGAVHLILQIVESEEVKELPHVLFNAAVIIFNIATCETLRSNLIEEGVSKILHILVEQERCHSLVAATLFLLSVHPSSRETIVQQGAVDILMDLSNVEDMEDPSKLGLITSCALAFLCISKEFKVQTLLKEKGLIPILVKLSKSQEATVHTSSGDALKNLSSDSGSGLDEGTVSALIGRSFESTQEQSVMGDEEEKVESKLIVPDMPAIILQDYRPPESLIPATRIESFEAYPVSYMKMEGGAAGQGPKPPEPPPMKPERVPWDLNEPSVIKAEEEEKGQKVMAYAKMDVPAHFNEPDDFEDALKSTHRTPASGSRASSGFDEELFVGGDSLLNSSQRPGTSKSGEALLHKHSSKTFSSGHGSHGSRQSSRNSNNYGNKVSSVNSKAQKNKSSTAKKTLEQQRQELGLW